MPLVCVPNTSRPVSAAVSQVNSFQVSHLTERITSGSSRSAAFNALAKVSVCLPTSLCETILLNLMVNSTGSSTVMMFDVLVLLISLIIADVVDLPDPVDQEYKRLMHVDYIILLW